ncbi:hypothetical protein ACHQM5_029473 [Ranunculus cassubicifolius]
MHCFKQRWQHFINLANLLQSRTTTSRSIYPFPATPISPNTNLWLQSLYSLSINLSKFLKHTLTYQQIVP